MAVSPADRIAAVRRFNRFYTREIGVLAEDWLDSPFSLTEARVLYEILHRDRPTAGAIAKDLGLDAGYLSRLLRGFAARGLIAREPSDRDGRQSLLSVTERGRRAYAPLETHTNEQVSAMLEALPAEAQARLIGAMSTIETLLEKKPEANASYVLRPHRPGDMGWIVSRHGAVYCGEYGWNENIEALTAEIVAGFLRNFDPRRECCLIAERAGGPAGCVLLVKKTERVAQLRLLLVDAEARGLGIGARLVDECIAFARAAGYREIMLWTHSVLTAARGIYQKSGFKLVSTKRHREFGRAVVGETWMLRL
jgi:DNA-binding MarR family transcriptional regulator/GNAT superfamily N-acetyltransferase